MHAPNSLARLVIIAALHSLSASSLPGQQDSLGPGVHGNRNKESISQLHPSIRHAAQRAVVEATSLGLHIRIHAPYRSLAESKEKFRKGVSKAEPGYSYHNYGLAFDITPVVVASSTWSNEAIGSEQGDLLWEKGLKTEEDKKEWKERLVPVFEKYGFTWGSSPNATHLGYDDAHFQTGIKLRMPGAENKGESVANILLEKVQNKETFTEGGRTYPTLHRKDFEHLGGKPNANKTLLQYIQIK